MVGSVSQGSVIAALVLPVALLHDCLDNLVTGLLPLLQGSKVVRGRWGVHS